jgi:hypothetical protein
MSATEKFIIAGYWALLTTATPLWRRIGVEVYERQLQDALSIAAARVTETNPEHKGYLDKLTAGRRIQPIVDEKFVRAIFTKQLTQFTNAFFCQDWTIIENQTGTLFITADNPSAIVPDRPEHAPITRFLPLAPDLGIITTIERKNIREEGIDLSKSPIGQITRAAVDIAWATNLNRIIVMNADEFIFSADSGEDIRQLVEAHRKDTVHVEHVHICEMPIMLLDHTYIRVSKLCRNNRARKMYEFLTLACSSIRQKIRPLPLGLPHAAVQTARRWPTRWNR